MAAAGWHAGVHAIQCACASASQQAASTSPPFPQACPHLAAPPACPSSYLQAERCDQAAIEAALKQAFEAADQEIVEEAVAK